MGLNSSGAQQADTKETAGRSRMRGFTLHEVVIAMALSTIIIVSLQSTLSLATQAIPKANSVLQRDIKAARVLKRLEIELETSTRILEASPTSFVFLVPDRDGDGVDELIRYQVTGSSNKQLMRQYKSNPSVILLEGIADFSVRLQRYIHSLKVRTPFEVGVVEQLGGQSQFYGFSSAIDASSSFGQSLVPSTTSGDLWRPTSVRLRIRRENNSSAVTVSLAPTLADGSPATYGASLSNATYTGGSIPSNFSDGYLTFPVVDAPWVRSTGRLAVTATMAPNAGAVSHIRNNFGSDMLFTANGTWSRSSFLGLDFQLYGQRATASGSQLVELPILERAELTLTTGAGRSPIYASCNLQNNVGDWRNLLSLDFEKSPLNSDDDADGTKDWATASGTAIDSAAMDGFWLADSQSIKSVDSIALNSNCLIDICCKAISANAGRAFIELNCFRNGANACPLRLVVRKESDGSQILTLHHPFAKTIYLASGLTSEKLELRLILSKALNAVTVLVDGISHGTFTLVASSVSASTPSIIIGAENGTAEFDKVRVQEWQP